MVSEESDREFFRQYDLVESRKQPPRKDPVSHQSKAIEKLDQWYDSRRRSSAGAILVLPTGGGKTFTAVRFLCRRALSDGYKVLWLAHTHHLLEQAFEGFEDGVSLIAEPKCTLTTRVVSGTPGHYPIHRIKSSDDVLIGTLQTISQGYKNSHPALKRFLDASKEKLFVVFDEAHHSPAPSYRQLVMNLRKQCRQMYLLGLTATPTHSKETKRGWLKKLFPQEIVHQVKPQKLMAAGILAQPISEEPRTHFTPKFDEREYRKWAGTHREIPEDIITKLALNRDRNQRIANYYVEHKKRFKKTLIFADRWYQCEQLSEFLKKKGVRTGTVYSHVDADPGSAEARNSRKKDENAVALERFRSGKIDVLLNVRMLTEGTDVPDITTVFLTRATTSHILLTQMVGRALRGPKFGGTEKAYIVSFIDNWKHLINWAEYDQLAEGLADATVPEYGKRPPIQLISIELVRRLVRQMDSGINMTPGPFLSLLPVGWYRVEYQTQVNESEDLEPVRELVMVFDNEQKNYKNLIQHVRVAGKKLKDFEGEGVHLEHVRESISAWQQQFFPERNEHYGTNLEDDIFKIVRHIAQNGIDPRFFKYEERDRHDLDAIAQESIQEDLGPLSVEQALRKKYNQKDRLWSTIYYRYDLFKSQFDACVNRLLHARRHGASPKDHRPQIVPLPPEERLEGSEPSQEIKQQVKQRDGYRCLCCTSSSKKSLEVDHVSPHYYGGGNLLDNLQTLCRECNRFKSIGRINFRDPQTDLSQPPASFSDDFKLPPTTKAGDPHQWEMYLRRCINFFYQCGAVLSVRIGGRGKYFYQWHVELKAGNDPRWLKPHLKDLLTRIRYHKKKNDWGMPESIKITAPGKRSTTYSVRGYRLRHEC